MNLALQIFVGALTGWLTGKVIESEGRRTVVKEGLTLDVIYGIIGAMFGEYLFFWIVIGKGSLVSDLATTILGSITLVGVVRLVTERLSNSKRH